MKPLLCVTVTAATTADLRRRRDDAAPLADIVELRLDGVRDLDVAGALAGRERPTIVTCRPEWEGGVFAGSEEERHRILEQAVALGAEHVDVEWRAGFEALLRTRGGKGIIVSSHDFDTTPADLRTRVDAMRSSGAEMVKLAVFTERLADVINVRDAGLAAASGGPAVAIAMGPAGLVSRTMPLTFGSAWSYSGSLDGIGQLSATELVREWRFRAVDSETRLYGVVGRPVAHSVSPALHNAAFAAAGINALYLPFPAADVDDFARFARAFGVAGASVTVPFKVDMLGRVDALSPVARSIGAVNTLCVEDGRWIGDNTDAAGFLAPLSGRVALDGLRVSILGGGGSALAVASALRGRAASVAVHARNHSQAENVARRAAATTGPWPPEPGTWDLLVNCTPVGMAPAVEQSPVPASVLTGRYVYDLVYNPPRTQLLREAAAVGCTTIGGLDMLLAQAEEQFRCWTGRPAPAGVMRRAAERRLAEWEPDENDVV